MATEKFRSAVRRIGFAVAIVALAGASTTAVSKRPQDAIRCRDYVCTHSCGETPYISGGCKLSGRVVPITIECCCCVEGANGRVFVGG